MRRCVGNAEKTGREAIRGRNEKAGAGEDGRKILWQPAERRAGAAAIGESPGARAEAKGGGGAGLGDLGDDLEAVDLSAEGLFLGAEEERVGGLAVKDKEVAFTRVSDG